MGSPLLFLSAGFRRASLATPHLRAPVCGVRNRAMTTMSTPVVRGLVPATWLAENLSDVVVLDASWHMPRENRDAEAEFLAGRIPGMLPR